MMTKQDILKKLTSFKGIGDSKAQLLYDSGFTSIEKLKNATVQDLTKIKGITEKTAQEILNQLNQPEPKAKTRKKSSPPKETSEKKMQTTPKEPSKAPTEETKDKDISKEPETSYQVKQKPKLDTTTINSLKIRKEIKKRTPTFLREEWFRYKRIPKNWRRPDGITSKMRINRKYRPSKVRIGFRTPKTSRERHPSGFEEILIHNPAELDNIDPDSQAVRIGGTVGTKKRLEIMKIAEKKSIRILNIPK